MRLVETHREGPEVALNQKVRNLIQKLGEAIHESVSESEDIAVVVKNIREQGFDVLLMLEATIASMRSKRSPKRNWRSPKMSWRAPFKQNDLTFLKSLRISADTSASSATD